MSKELEFATRHKAASHAIQSGVAMEMNYRPQLTEPKHLRVGVNAAMVEHAALVDLLITKGIITKLEYLEAIATAMEAEQRSYEEHLSSLVGAKITLG